MEKYGTVRSVSVTAWPAVELLWGRAGSVDVRAGKVQLSTAQMAKLLGEARGAESLYVTAESLKAGPLQLESATLQKHGDALAGQRGPPRRRCGPRWDGASKCSCCTVAAGRWK